MPDRRNPTIQEENEEAEDMHPDQEALDLFYSFLSQKYQTAAEKLAYFELVLKLEQLYKKTPLKKSFKLKF